MEHRSASGAVAVTLTGKRWEVAHDFGKKASALLCCCKFGLCFPWAAVVALGGTLPCCCHGDYVSTKIAFASCDGHADRHWFRKRKGGEQR